MIESIDLPDKYTYGNGFYSETNRYISILHDVRDDLADTLFKLLKDETVMMGWEYRFIEPDILIPLLDKHFEPLLINFPRFKFDVSRRYPFTDKDLISIDFRRTFRQ